MLRSRAIRYVLGLATSLVFVLAFYRHFVAHHDTDLQVIVAEEPYEGVLYWLHAAAVDNIRPRGNTLLYFGISLQNNPVLLPSGKDTIQIVKSNPHISAHFCRPKTMFQTALQAGLIDHIVWVWPEWEGNKARPNHVKGKISSGKKGEDPCSCVEREGEPDRSCQYMNRDMEILPAEQKHCEVHSWCTFEEINIKLAYEKFADPTLWHGHDKDLIIHIDEGFFSSIDRKKVFRDAGLTDSFLRKFNDLIGAHYCPINRDLELTADELASDLITNFAVKCGKVAQDQECSSKVTDIELVDKFMDDFDTSSMDQETARVFCSRDLDVNKGRLTKLVQMLKSMNGTQLTAVQKTGFCLNMAPASASKVTGMLFKLCYSNASSEDSKFYNASLNELSVTLDYFGQLLATPSMPSPSIITIARLVRTGTTDANDFSHIEGSLLESLEAIGFGKHYRVKDVYDGNLLGGLDGWTRRRAYMSIMDDLL